MQELDLSKPHLAWPFGLLAACALLAASSNALADGGGDAGQPHGPTAAPRASLDDGCRRCDHRGVSACSKHSSEILEAETRVLFCSVVAHCEDCHGSLVVDCPHCDGGPGSAAMEARLKEVAEWLSKSPVEAHFGREVPRCETRRFEVVLEVEGKFKENKKTIDAHGLMHLVADDCEFVARGVDEHFDIEDGDLFAKMRMWMWPTAKDHASAVLEFMRQSARGDFKLLGKDPVFSVWQEPGLFSSAPAIRSVFAHNAGHMLVSNLDRERDVSVIGGGWFDAGLAHWYEYERFGQSTNYCIEEASAGSSFANGVWKAAMRKLVKGTDGPLFLQQLDTATTAMDVTDQAICWSFYDWLVANHQPKIRPLLRGLKAATDTRELFKEHLDMTVLQAEEAWRAWVLETYPKKEKRRR